MSSSVKSSEPWIGIDMGANFCRVGAIVDGVLRIFASENGCKEVLSAFSLKKDKHLVGRYALNTVPTSVIFDACQDHHLNNAPAEESPVAWSCQQDRNGCYSIGEEGGEHIYQQQVMAIILSNLKEVAERNLGVCVKNVVISIPSYCTNNYRYVVHQAALIAGFENTQLLNQSTAAAITYKLNNFRQKETRKVGIFCLGGNSVEVSVFCMSQNTATLVASNGSAEFGGNTFTNSMMQAVLSFAYKKLKNQNGFTKKFIKAVWFGCERAKLDLASFQKTDLIIDAFEEEIRIRFSRDNLFKICKKNFDELQNILAEIFGPYQHDIWEVMLVGGASKMAGLKELIRNHVHPRCTFVPAIVAEEAVVSGAIIKASIASCNPVSRMLM
uniref:Uncharacterized protein n=1 Tax=Ditylenchus dipsaci TaxID=166011 RepID=A0A915CUU1_9BILA